MGKIFLEHSNGEELFDCAACNTNLTHKGHLISVQMADIIGEALLFEKVENIKLGETILYISPTEEGYYTRDVTCKNCDSYLGWMYEFAPSSQKYKEGKVALERELIKESKGFSNK